VVDDQVEEQPISPLPCLLSQLGEVAECPEPRIDPVVVRHVITVRHGAEWDELD